MAYRRKQRKTARKSYKRSSARKSYRRAAPKRRKTASRKRAASRSQKIVLVVQQAPVTPTLATPAAKAAPRRARFGG